MKPILAFETSSPTLSIALFDGKKSISEKNIHGYMNHAEKILPETDKLLKKKKISFHRLETLLIGRGPGSFTGLRVGFATLKGFSTLKKKKCLGALSLDLVAENVTLPQGSLLCVCLDAHRDKVYVRFYKRSAESWKAKGKPETLDLEAWLKKIPASTALMGNGVARYREIIEKANRKKWVLLPDSKNQPKASTLIRFFQKDPKKLQPLESPKDFIPLYFRLSEAEERFNERKLNSKAPKHANAC